MSRKFSANPWVQVEFEGMRAIKQIKIYHRRLSRETMASVEVRIGNNEVSSEDGIQLSKNDLCGKYERHGKPSEIVITCSSPVTGKYVTTQMTDNEIQKMDIAELELYGQVIGNSDIYILLFLILTNLYNHISFLTILLYFSKL